jgi:hypothetical protein
LAPLLAMLMLLFVKHQLSLSVDTKISVKFMTITIAISGISNNT